jgi:hypothetical protein
MDAYYYFFDRSPVDPLWKLSWQDFLRLHGKSRWAMGPQTNDGAASLRSLIAFAVESEPSATEIDKIIDRRTLRWSIQHSSPQFYMIEEVLNNISPLRKSHVSVSVWENDFVVLLAAAADFYFRHQIPSSMLKAVLKLHYSKFEDFIRLSKQEHAALRHMMNVNQYAKPIYPWQGSAAVLEEEWAGCLGYYTRDCFSRYWIGFGLIIRKLFAQTVLRVLEGIELYTPDAESHRFRDFGISRRLRNIWTSRVRSFQRPCVFWRSE